VQGRLDLLAPGDPTGGAGLQLDLQVFRALGVHGAGVITALTVQDTARVHEVLPAFPSVVLSQLRAVLADPSPDAVKIGMLATDDVARNVELGLRELDPARRVPIVIDPVLAASDGTPLLERRGYPMLQDLIAASKEKGEGGLKWGTTFAGGADHVAIHNFTKAAGGIPYTIVPFKGGGAIVTNLVGGNVEAALLNYAEGEAQFGAGEIRAVAVLAEKRIGSLADTPTAKEKGVDSVASTVRGFAVLKGVPEDRMKALEKGLLKAMGHAVYQGYLDGGGMPKDSVVGMDEWNKVIRRMYDESHTALKELGLL